MKILFFIYSLSSGGAERVTVTLSNYWVKNGWDVSIFTLSSKEHDFYALDGRVKRIDSLLYSDTKGVFFGIINNVRRIFGLRKVLKQLEPNIAIAMMSSANILLALSSIGLKEIKVIGSEHTHPPRIPLGRVWEFLRKKLYGRLACITALTETSARWIKENTNANKVTVIPNPAPYPLDMQAPYLHPQSICADKKILLSVGRLSDEKGFDILLSVYAKIASEFDDWILVILGDGPDRIFLENYIESYGLCTKAILPGRAGNMSEWYASASLYVMCSRFEGFGNTLAEALVHGVPAISFDCETGPRTILRDKIDGFLIPQNDIEKLQNSLRLLMLDNNLRQRMANNALENRSKFSTDRVAKMWEKLF